MMKTIYLAVLFLLTLAVIVFARLAGEKKNRIGRTIHVLLIFAIIAIAANSTFVMSDIDMVAITAHSIFCACIDWLLLLMLRYALLFTEQEQYVDRLFVPMAVIAGIETISLMANPVLHHMFTVEQAYSPSVGDYYVAGNYSVLYYIHLVYGYAAAALIFVVLFYKMYHTPKIYRTKYIVVMLCFAMVVAFDVIMVVIHLPIDISLLGYCAVSIEICYYTLWYVPKSMISSTLANAVQMADMGVICFDFQGNCIYLNIQGRQILERYYGMTLNNNLNELEDFFSDWLAKNWKDSDLEREITEKRESKLGEKYFSITVQKLLDEEHNHLGYYMNLQDRTVEQKYFNEQLFRISHDEVTGLYNTQYFQQKVSEMLHQFPDTPYVLVTSDIKDFKFINDFFGREIGDDLLKMHAKLLREMQGPNAVYGRVGIDKFAYCMPKERYSEHMFLQAMDVLVQEFTNKFFKIQIDMAVYEIHDIDEPVYQMCDKCDFAIDKIKADYSTRIAYYDENMLEEEMKKNAIINEFDKALMNGEFQMYLQAQTTADGRMVGAEALARWIHPDKGLIPPGEFIPVLEEAGLIYRLDLYIWNQAAKTLAQWKAAGKDNFTISVNISAQDQYYLDIYKVFTELVTTYHIDPINLKLEITESIFITEVEKHLHLINQLQAYGFEVEIDDFGSGYSSLNILKDIAADVIKIDMGFLRETDNAARSRDIIAAVIRLAKSLHMTVITEGVETKEQVEALDAMGCDIYQGYYFAKPIPLKEFEDKYHIYFK